MQTFQAAHATLAPRHRIASACAALGTSAALLGLVVAVFAAAASSPWLPDTPEAVAKEAACSQAGSRPARDACMRETVARWQAAERRGLRVASGR